MDITIAFLGGLGLFLTGLRTLSNSTRQLSGKWLRTAVAAGTRGPVTSAATGLLAGGITQSTSALTLLASGLVQSGLLQVRRALPLLSWGNVGTTGVVLLASLDTHAFAMLLVGVAGMLIFFRVDLKGRLQPALGVLLGLGVLFLGLAIIKAGVLPLKDIPAAQALLAGENQWLLPPFLAACFIAVLSQTSSTAVLIALTFNAAGLLTYDQTAIAVYGAAVGSGLATFAAARDVRGTARRLAVYQLLWKVFGASVFLLLFVAERLGLPLVLAAADWLTDDPEFRIGLVMLIFHLGTALMAWPLDRVALRLLERLSPETAAEALSRPRFVHAAAAEDPATAVALVAQEQARLAARLPQLLDRVREDADPGAPARQAIDDGSSVLERTVDEFLAEALALGGQGAERSLVDGLVALRARGADLAALREAASGFAALVEAEHGAGGAFAATLGRMTEALHLLLSEFADALAAPGAEAAATLRAMTEDRSEVLDGLRRGMARSEERLAPAQQETLLRAIALFERAAWLIRRQSLGLLG